MLPETAPLNWIADNTRAPKPPAYFLQRLFDFDAMLVVMPSREHQGSYVLGRRKQFGPGLTPAALDAVYTKPDTKMCILHGAVPVCMMYQVGTSWDPEPIIAKLMARDIWAHGGAEKVATMLEEQEAAEKAKLRAEIRDDIYNRSGAAWRSYQARTGQSSIKFNDNYPTKSVTDSPSTEEVAASSNTAGARSTAGSAATTAEPSAAPGLSAGAEP